MSSEMELVVGVDGMARCIYDEALDLREIGKLQITRASHVEPDRDGFWWADMGPSGGPVLGPFGSRTEALQAERGWLVGQIVETASNQRLPGTAPDALALLAAFEANRCRSGLAYR
jgi:hypothetical protein